MVVVLVCSEGKISNHDSRGKDERLVNAEWDDETGLVFWDPSLVSSRQMRSEVMILE